MSKTRIYLLIASLVVVVVLALAWNRGHDLRTGEREPANSRAVVTSTR